MSFAGCRSGYGQEKLPEGVSAHIFPKDPIRRDLWIKAIPRADWIPAQNARVCSLHFEDSDYKGARKDSNPSRQLGELKTRQLKPDAVPRKFPGLPAYLSSLQMLCYATYCFYIPWVSYEVKNINLRAFKNHFLDLPCPII